MKIFAITLVLLLSQVSSAEILCLGSKKLLKNSGGFQKHEILKYTGTISNVKSYAIDIEDLFFSVKDDNSGSYLLIISEGPSYNWGTSVRGSFDKQGILKISVVRDDSVYTLSCTQ